MTFLWRLSDTFPDRMYGKFNKQRGPSQFAFWKGKDISEGLPTPDFYFDAAGKSLDRWDVLGNDAGLPLVSPRLIKVLSTVAANDVQYLEANVTAKTTPMEGWSLLNPLNAVKAIDRESSDFWLIPGAQQIGGFRKLRFVANCLGSYHIARDAEYLAHILVDLDVKLAFERAGIRGVTFIPPEDFLN